ncbi:hypothetical protein DIPPA_29167 [Diplonema papillatum]|nr:hypothetical protein DIPPA_29167 [Diplonema papillatum]
MRGKHVNPLVKKTGGKGKAAPVHPAPVRNVGKVGRDHAGPGRSPSTVVLVPKQGPVRPSALRSRLATWCGLYARDSMDLPFEVLLFVYALVHLALQNYTIYRTNLLDVDGLALCFSLAAIVRRIAWKQAQAAFRTVGLSYTTLADPARAKHRTSEDGSLLSGIFSLGADNKPRGGLGVFALFSLVTGTTLCVSVACAVGLLYRYGIGKAVWLAFPVAMYIATAFHLGERTCDKCFKIDLVPDSAASDFVLSQHNVTFELMSDGGPRCVHVYADRSSFAALALSVVSVSLTTAYYTTLLPTIFVSTSHVYWPVSRTRLITVVVLVNTAVLLASRLLSSSFLHLFASAHAYGAWKQMPPSDKLAAKEASLWCPDFVYPQGALVRYHPDAAKVEKVDSTTLPLYKGLGFANCSAPDDFIQMLTWKLSSSPCKTQACITLFQQTVSLGLLLVAMQSVAWLVVCTMLLFNYLLLFIALQAKRTSSSDHLTQDIMLRLSNQ